MYLWPCRASQDSGSAGAPSWQKFLLKWSIPLSLVDVVEFGSSEDVGDSGRFPPPHSVEKLVISTKPSRCHCEAAVQICFERRINSDSED